MTIIRVGSKPSQPEGLADFLDGRSAVVQRVEFEVNETANCLTIRPPSGPTETWPLAELREVPDQAETNQLVLTTTTRALARLILTDQIAIAVVRRRAPKLSRRPPVKGKIRVLAWAAAAIASVFVIVFFLVPVMADQLARFLPARGEQALGSATLEQIQEALGSDFSPVGFCSTPDGDEAAKAMLARLEGDGLDLPYPVQISVLDHELINAFALPGGHVVFFRGMLDVADGPDEIAAVMAHEIGHVAARDPTRIALRSAGSLGVLGLLFGDFAGGAVVLFLVEQLIHADYSREAEAAADDYGIAIMKEAGVDPAALGILFEKLQNEFGEAEGVARHFASHPALGDRIVKSKNASDGLTSKSPSLEADQWQALKSICD